MRLANVMLAASALLLTGCPSTSTEPPPPPRKPEIPAAPPRARGALAAGTDAAPRPDVTLPGGEAEPDAPQLPSPAAPTPPEDSATPPEKPAPPAVAPDAGMAL